ncbi:hypothetical protein AKJ16_DCAP08843 [Drosera capensis]
MTCSRRLCRRSQSREMIPESYWSSSALIVWRQKMSWCRRLVFAGGVGGLREAAQKLFDETPQSKKNTQQMKSRANVVSDQKFFGYHSHRMTAGVLLKTGIRRDPKETSST